MTSLPPNLSRPARGLYAWMVLLADEHGEVHGREPTEDRPAQSPQSVLGQAMGCTRNAVLSQLAELEAYGLVHREGSTRGQRLFVDVLAQKTGQDGCTVCGKPAVRGKAWCPRCAQVFGRSDRSWKDEAVGIFWRARRADPKIDPMRIAYRIHVATGRTLWGSSTEGEQGSGTGSGEGVIPAMVALGFFPPEMMEYARNARNGGRDGW